MKKIVLVTLLGVAIAGLLLTSCSKGAPAGAGSAGGTTGGYFFENTEWVGTAILVAREYDQPIALNNL